MRSSTNCSSSRGSFRLALVLVWLLAVAGCAHVGSPPKGRTAGDRLYRVAVFPVENLSGGKAPLNEVRLALIEKLKQAGVDVVAEKELNSFLASHRLRYTGGVDHATAQALRDELKADGVMITTLETYGMMDPPRVAVTARLVAAAETAEIVWMESVGMAGDDAPGLFETGVVHDHRLLLDRALNRLSSSFLRHLAGSGDGGQKRGRSKFPPRVMFCAEIDAAKDRWVAVMPFANRSDRKYAGELLTLHFVNQLRKAGFQVIEPGVLRHQLLQYRVIMEEGLSLANADVIFTVLGADYLVTGKVTEYLEPLGSVPKVDFSASMLERENRKVVAASEAISSGDDRVVFFDFGRVGTAHTLAAEMVRGVAERIGEARR